LRIGQLGPIRTAHDYQRESNYEEYGKGRVVEEAIDCQQRRSDDEEETGDCGELAQSSHRYLERR